MAESNEIKLLPGWSREVVRRRGAGKSRIYYVSPKGFVIKSKAGLKKLLGDRYPLGAYDFQAGDWKWPEVHDRICHEHDEGPPQRAIPPALRRPVMVIRNHPKSQTRHDLNYGPQEKPYQVSWWKRLAKIYPRDVSEEIKHRKKKSFGQTTPPDSDDDSSSDQASVTGFPPEQESSEGWELTSEDSCPSTSSMSTGGSPQQADLENLETSPRSERSLPQVDLEDFGMSPPGERPLPQADFANFGLAGFLQPPSQGQEEHQPGSEEKANQSQ